MNSVAVTIRETIEREIKHSETVQNVFLRALCLFETYYQKRPSSLLQIFPDLEGIEISDAEVVEMKKVLICFIEKAPTHGSLTTAIWLLSISRDQNLKQFFIKHLRLHLGWRHAVAVSTLLAALEDLGEKVFYTADGCFIGSRSSLDTDTNFDVAKRYLEKCPPDA